MDILGDPAHEPYDALLGSTNAAQHANVSAGQQVHIGVFCGASTTDLAKHRACAKQVGWCIGKRGHVVVYGAAATGLMGDVALGAQEAGGTVVGVVPRFLREREKADELSGQILLLTDDLFERKRVIMSLADGYIILPGGIGTLDELLEVISTSALGLEDKPIIMLNVDRLWDPLLDFLDALQQRGYIGPSAMANVHVVEKPEAAVAKIAALRCKVEHGERANRPTTRGSLRASVADEAIV